MLHDKSIRDKKKSVKSACKSKKPVKAAESYGWVVDENEAWEAYEFACEYFGKDNLDDQIVTSLGVDELASSLAFIFRMNDFREWEQYKDGTLGEDDIEESVRSKGRKSVKASKLRKGKNRKSITAARLTIDFGKFEPWSGAVDTWRTLEEYDKIDLLEQILDDTYYNEEVGEAILSETELNDLLWFDPETVYEWVGLYYNDETGEVSDEPFDDEIKESVRAKGRKSVKGSVRKKNKPIKASNKKAVKASESAPHYELVDYFDVWGNPEDGFEVNNLAVIEDDIVISDDSTDEEILDYLINTIGWLSPDAKTKVEVNDLGDGFIEFEVAETGEPLGRLQLKY